jgi:ComF family protein
VLGWLLDAVFPARCIGCARRGTPLCIACKPELPYLPDGVCWRCASRRGARGVCRGCRRLSSVISSLRAPFAYEGAARTAILTLKFRSGRYLAPLMGTLLCEELAVRPLEADLVVPVPLSPGRLRQRGFNQAQLLAEHVAESVRGTLVVDVLTRCERPPQSTLKLTDRLSNVAGAFACAKPRVLSGKRILLVDDVVTTGATVSACADTLADAGARRIAVLAFARDL